MTHRDHKFNYELWAEFANLGLFGCLVPEEYGGNDTGLLALTLAFEDICALGFSPSLMLVTCMDTACILKNGTEEMKRKIVPGVLSGKTILVFAVTEPNAPIITVACLVASEPLGPEVALPVRAPRDAQNAIASSRPHQLA